MAINTLLEKYDLFYTNQATASLGFMLSKNKAGAKLWRRDDQRALPDSFAPGDISYANLSPDIQKTIAHRYMNGGLGALEYEVDDDALYQLLRYLRSQNLDCRCKGKVYPGPKIIETLFVPKNVSPTSATDPSTEWSNEANAHDEDISTAATCTHFIARWYGYLELAFTAVTSSEIAIKVDREDAEINNVEVQVYYSAGWHTLSDPPWGVLTVLAIGSTQSVSGIRVRTSSSTANNKVSYVYEAWAIKQDGNSIGGFSLFNDKKYGYTENLVFKLNAGGTGYTAIGAFENDVTHIAVFPSNLFIALAAANKYWYMSSAESFTESNVASAEADRLCQVGTDFWQLKLPNKLKKSTNPLNGGAWGAEILVGDAGYNINDMWEHDGKLHCLKEDGVFEVTTAGVVTELFPELKSISHADAGKNSTVFRDGLYFRMGNQQEWELKGGVLTEVTPEIFSSGISQYAYPCVARAHDESWLYAIIKRGATDLAILAGRWEYVAGRARWVWHEIRSIDLTDVSTAFVCSVEGRPYLYLGSTGADENVYKVYLPVTNDATADSGYRFHTAGSLWTPRYMSLLFAVTKRWLEVFMRSLSLSATNYINAYYSTDDGGSWTLLKKFDTSPEQTEAFTSIEATMMNLRFDFVGDSETVPPILKYHSLTAMTLMPSVTRFYHTVKCADGLRLKKNHVASPSYTYAVIQAFIETLRDKVVTLGDRQGNEHTVLVRVGREVETYDEEIKKPALLYDIEAVKL